jgi:hypothetical protein
MNNSHKRVGATRIKHGLVKTPTIYTACPSYSEMSFVSNNETTHDVHKK